MTALLRRRVVASAVVSLVGTATVVLGTFGGLGGLGARGAAAAARNCVSGAWPNIVRGFPDKLLDSDDTSSFVWSDIDGWHLRVTHNGTRRMVFRGSVETTRELQSVSRSAGSNREVRFTKDRKQATFEFVNYGGVDGIDFQVGCSSGLLLRITLDEQPLTPDQVFLGENAEHPPSMPVRIER